MNSPLFRLRLLTRRWKRNKAAVLGIRRAVKLKFTNPCTVQELQTVLLIFLLDRENYIRNRHTCSTALNVPGPWFPPLLCPLVQQNGPTNFIYNLYGTILLTDLRNALWCDI